MFTNAFLHALAGDGGRRGPAQDAGQYRGRRRRHGAPQTPEAVRQERVCRPSFTVYIANLKNKCGCYGNEMIEIITKHGYVFSFKHRNMYIY